MQVAFSITEHAPTPFLGSRFLARQLRDELEQLLRQANEVELDFSGMLGATQSFIDELLGVLVLTEGSGVVQRLIFRGCTEDMKQIISSVISTRLQDLQRIPSTH